VTIAKFVPQWLKPDWRSISYGTVENRALAKQMIGTQALKLLLL
jgi:hypothetical protein